jgi:hypothetical protein
VLQIFISLKNPSSSAGFEPTNLESNGKHANHYSTEDDWSNYSLRVSDRRVPRIIFEHKKREVKRSWRKLRQ